MKKKFGKCLVGSGKVYTFALAYEKTRASETNGKTQAQRYLKGLHKTEK